MTITVKTYTDNKGIEMVQLKKTDYEKLLLKIKKLESTVKLVKGIECGMDDLNKGNISPIKNLFA